MAAPDMLQWGRGFKTPEINLKDGDDFRLL